ncbi:MAG: AAA family ATPase [Candidatus Latescibacter sp.]|nr:AAA family ATPase [Candidatus Latescibacter sp.]
MKILETKIENFRGIRSLTIDLRNSKTSLLIGINGSGKSTVLDCIAILMSWLHNRIRFPSSNGIIPTEIDINNDQNETKIEATVSYQEKEYTWNIVKTRSGRRKQKVSDLRYLKNIASMILDDLERDVKSSIPLVVYYPVNRAVLDIPLRIRKKHSFDQFSAYENALAGRGADFRTFFEWYREQEDLENENYTLFKTSEQDPQLYAVRSAVYSLTGFTNLRVRRNRLRMEVNKNNEILRVNQLSDGEKCLLALAGDLARRLTLANPSLDNPLTGEAVVLIDEIDLHLHPRWQREVITKLQNTFPQCQFIVTTHSPQVISEAQSAIFYTLENTSEGIQASLLENVYGRDSNQILEDVMETSERPIEIKKMLLEYFDHIDRGKLSEASVIRKNLEEVIGSDEPVFAKADTLIRRKEILGR